MLNIYQLSFNNCGIFFWKVLCHTVSDVHPIIFWTSIMLQERDQGSSLSSGIVPSLLYPFFFSHWLSLTPVKLALLATLCGLGNWSLMAFSNSVQTEFINGWAGPKAKSFGCPSTVHKPCALYVLGRAVLTPGSVILGQWWEHLGTGGFSALNTNPSLDLSLTSYECFAS